MVFLEKEERMFKILLGAALIIAAVVAFIEEKAKNFNGKNKKW